VVRADLLFGLLGPKQETWFTGIDNLEPGQCTSPNPRRRTTAGGH
jgi:hypothetical protein